MALTAVWPSGVTMGAVRLCMRARAQMYTGHMQREFVPPQPACDDAAKAGCEASRTYLKQVSSRERPSMAS